MQLTLATLALAAASIVAAQGVTGVIAPAGGPPSGCSTSYSGTFEISVSLPPHAKRSIEERQSSCSSGGTLVASLAGSVLTDSKGRIGAIVANHQFQFDGPPSQAGSIYTGGFSVCNNGSLALGPSAIFYQCLSGSFYNLYDTPAGASCEAIVISIIPCSGSGGPGPVSQTADGQPNGPSATSAATQITDGQVQASSAGPHVTQIGDGQVQASSAVPVSQFTDGQIQVTATPAPAPTPVGQITDGQVQATSASVVAPVSQATSAPAVVQITDGQVQATSAGNLSTPTATPATPSHVNSAGMMSIGVQVVAGVAALVAVVML